MINIENQTQKFSVGVVTTFVEIDFSPVYNFSNEGPAYIHICNAVGDNGEKRVFDSKTWDFVDFEFSNIDSDISGSIPEPELLIHANYQPLRDAFIVFDDLRGATVTRYRYFHDADNFITDKYFVWKLDKFDQDECSLTLSVSRGLDDAESSATRVLPTGLCIRQYRTYNSTTGEFEYKSVANGGCPYGQWANTGTPYFDKHNNQVTDKSQDKCPKTYPACIKRFDPTGSGEKVVPMTAILRQYSSNCKSE